MSKVKDRPAASLIIPAYLSSATILKSVQSFIAATTPNDEIIVVDSSPNRDIEDLLEAIDSRVKVIHSDQQLNPHEARMLGLRHSKHHWLLFSDPDIYAPPDWLSHLFDVQQNTGADAIAGALVSFTRDYLSQGIHLVKFHYWLPGGSVRPISLGASANLLVSRNAFESVGGFNTDYFSGDSWLSLVLQRDGYQVCFAPEAPVYHHHLSTWAAFLRERYFRAYDEQIMRHQFSSLDKPWPHLLRILVSLLPLRLAKILAVTAYRSALAELLGMFFATLPVIITGTAAWLLGDARAHWDLIFQSGVDS